MRKVPVFATIAKAYGFLGREFPTILRLSWFPILIAVTCQYVLFSAAYGHFVEALRGREELSVAAFTGLEIGVAIFHLVMTTIVAVTIHRLILLDERRPRQFLYISFGRAELIFILLPVMAGILVSIVAGGAVVAMAYLLPDSGAPHIGQQFLTMAPPLMIFAIIVFLAVRLCLAFPLAALEKRLLLAQAWQLSRENFWRLFAVGTLGLLPLIFVFALCEELLVNSEALSAAPNVGEALLFFEQEMQALSTRSILAFISTIVGGALGVGLLSYSFKALSDRLPAAPTPP